MLDKDFIQEIKTTLLLNRWRTLLTLFGVFWGMYLLVMLVSAGIGISNGVAATMKALPENCIYSYSNPTSLACDGFPAGRQWRFTSTGTEQMQARHPEDIVGLSYINIARDNGVPASNELYSTTAMLAGTNPITEHAFPHEVTQGRYITERDMLEERNVCVVGQQVARELFAGEEPLGQLVNVDGLVFTVVGVCRSTFGMADMQIDFERAVFVPLPIVRKAYNQGDDVMMLGVMLADDADNERLLSVIEQELKEAHHVSPDDHDALFTFDLKARQVQFRELSNGIIMLVWVVGLGILLSGLIGITNIELISVKERTRELAIRSIIGASPSHIILQIICECLAIASLAGFLGLAAGAVTLHYIRDFLETLNGAVVHPHIPIWVVVISLLLIIIGGISAGIVPAIQALNLKPADAIAEK